MYYDYGEATETHPEYFQKQAIYNLTLGLYVRPQNIFTIISPGIDLSIGEGSTEFSQLSFDLSSKIDLFKAMSVNVDMNYKLKLVSKELYDNYSFAMNLQYKF